MNELDLKVAELAREMLVTVVMLAGPVLLVGLVVGVAVSVFQALTSVQEQTLSLVPKMLAVMGTQVVRKTRLQVPGHEPANGQHRQQDGGHQEQGQLVHDAQAQAFRHGVGTERHGDPVADAADEEGTAVDLFWIPLGAGTPVVQMSGRLFERFFRGTNVRLEELPGTGLGLSICRQIMETYGGSITASNRHAPDGKVLGARFTIRIPAATGRK